MGQASPVDQGTPDVGLRCCMDRYVADRQARVLAGTGRGVLMLESLGSLRDMDETTVVVASGMETQGALDLRAGEALAEVYRLLARRGRDLRCHAMPCGYPNYRSTPGRSTARSLPTDADGHYPHDRHYPLD